MYITMYKYNYGSLWYWFRGRRVATVPCNLWTVLHIRTAHFQIVLCVNYYIIPIAFVIMYSQVLFSIYITLTPYFSVTSGLYYTFYILHKLLHFTVCYNIRLITYDLFPWLLCTRKYSLLNHRPLLYSPL